MNTFTQDELVELTARLSKIASHLDNAKRLNEMGYGRVRNEMLDAVLEMVEFQTFFNEVKDREDAS